MAAGEGRRCRPLTQTRSKVMLPVGNRPFMEHMIGYADSYDIVVPGPSDGLQPLHALYSKRCLAPIKKLIDADNLKITGFYRGLKTFVIKDDAIRHYDPKGEMFLNINSKMDLERVSSH